MNDLKQLLRDTVADAPPGHLDLASIVATGHRRVRARRTTAFGGVALAVAGVVVAASLVGSVGGDRAEPASTPPRPDAPTMRLADAKRAVEGRDYDVLASYTNENLNRDNGQYLDGVTDDGLILFRNGPRDGTGWQQHYALMDPATGEKDWLPDLKGVGQDQLWPVELGADQLVLVSLENGLRGAMRAHVFDRTDQEWRTLTWPGLPKTDFPRAQLGPDHRLYVRIPATQGEPPAGGWPTASDGEADDADAAGDTFHLWSVSLTESSDVRDEQLSVGDVAFTASSMMWTDRTNGDAGSVHVRGLASGDEHSFDPHAGERCNLLGFGATDDRVVMSEYCGTYDDGVRDDRVQILTADGAQVVTLQGSGLDGVLPSGSEVVNASVYAGDDDSRSGTYVYDLSSDRFLRISDGLSQWGLGGPTGDARQVMWHTPVNHRNGATQWVGRLRD
ncbi:hypothetical protein HIDPHFAB_02564 [Nocardioides sp. T2.26MG-1]|nr:hypothetical protein HIDPHFAB_02564 [Nocardioides sp. T2.26MG-1]